MGTRKGEFFFGASRCEARVAVVVFVVVVVLHVCEFLASRIWVAINGELCTTTQPAASLICPSMYSRYRDFCARKRVFSRSLGSWIG